MVRKVKANVTNHHTLAGQHLSRDNDYPFYNA